MESNEIDLECGYFFHHFPGVGAGSGDGVGRGVGVAVGVGNGSRGGDQTSSPE